MYNIAVKQRCGSDYPPDAARAIPYLQVRRRSPTRLLRRQSAKTVSALHAGAKGVAFQQCNDTVGAQFVAPLSRPSIELLPSLIERGVDVLLFAGMWDVRRSCLAVV